MAASGAGSRSRWLPSNSRLLCVQSSKPAINILNQHSRQEFEMLGQKRLAVLGAGKLGETLIKGLIQAGVTEPSRIRVTAGHQQRLDYIRDRFGIEGTLSNLDAAAQADIVILSVKPQT